MTDDTNVHSRWRFQPPGTSKRHLQLVGAPPDTCSINIRLSKKAGDQNLSRKGMEADARALAARHGLRVINVWVDEKSGAIRDREGFQGWLADGREGRAAVLIAYHVDRMTREGVNVAAAILDVVEGKDAVTGKVVRPPVRLMDCKGLDSEGDETAFRFQLVIAAELARGERARMSDRSRDMHKRFKAEGKATGGPPPYGFQLKDAKKDRRYIPLPEQAANLRRTAEQVWLIGTPAGKDVTLGSIVRWMNGPQGFKPLRAKAWTRTTMTQCLTKTPECTDVDIFTPDERASLRKILIGRGTPSGRKRGGGHGRPGLQIASGGLLACASCGTTMVLHPRKRAGTGQRVKDYRCNAVPGVCPRSVGVFSEFMDDYLEARFLFDYGDQLEYDRRATVTGYAAVEEAELAVAAALRELEKDATPEHFAALQAAQAQRAAAEAIPQTAEVQVVPTGRTIREAWHAADMLTKQAMLRNVWGKILVGPGKKGQRSLDLNRLTFVGRPLYVDGVHETVTFVPGSVVVVAEAEDEEAARDRELA